jgi:cytochrome c5
MFRLVSAVLAILMLSGCGANSEQPSEDAGATQASGPVYRGDQVGHYGYGTNASIEQIAAWDIDVRPDGLGLPVGRGSVEDGEILYEEQCAECHGSFGEGVGRYPVLAGGVGSLTDDRPSKTIGSFWPYTSTLFDYIYRAMPFAQPESLSVDETYAITAYVLYLNDILEDDVVLTHENLATIRLPNEHNFVADPRPDVSNGRCMTNCRNDRVIEFHSEAASSDPTIDAVALPDTPPDVGQVTYEQYCSVCHRSGVGGAPIVGEQRSWQTRLEQGVQKTVLNAINGMSSGSSVMPAKGGFVHLSDQEVTEAVHYMVEKSL